MCFVRRWPASRHGSVLPAENLPGTLKRTQFCETVFRSRAVLRTACLAWRGRRAPLGISRHAFRMWTFHRAPAATSFRVAGLLQRAGRRSHLSGGGTRFGRRCGARACMEGGVIASREAGWSRCVLPRSMAAGWAGRGVGKGGLPHRILQRGNPGGTYRPERWYSSAILPQASTCSFRARLASRRTICQKRLKREAGETRRARAFMAAPFS